MSMRGTKALREHEWVAGQYREGSEDGFNDRQGRYSDQHYQKGYRAGQARRNRMTILPHSEWLGNGFGVRTTHRAWLRGEVVGEWSNSWNSIPTVWGETRVPMSYKAWLAAMKAGETARIEAEKAERQARVRSA